MKSLLVDVNLLCNGKCGNCVVDAVSNSIKSSNLEACFEYVIHWGLVVVKAVDCWDYFILFYFWQVKIVVILN